jgi:RimJ/RimL family protein N-acetyltransferase
VSDRVVLRGSRVTLRPFRAEEHDRLVRLYRDSSEFVGEVDEQGLRRRIANSGRLIGGRLDLAIEVGGALVGNVDARHPPGALPPGVYELGIELFADARGRGYGSEAIELLTEHLFQGLGAGRVQASTAVGNRPMRRVFEKLGFREEGVMRAFMPRSGGRRDDFVLYARVAAD